MKKKLQVIYFNQENVPLVNTSTSSVGTSNTAPVPSAVILRPLIPLILSSGKYLFKKLNAKLIQT